MKSCAQVRRRLSLRSGPHAPELSAHLDRCRPCARFAARFALARQALRDHHAAIEPDAGFAARVASRLARPEDMLGWAALRVLPVALALALVLGVLASFHPPESPAAVNSTIASAYDDLLVWLAQPTGEAP